MNYLKQINAFYKSLISVSLSSNAQALYNFLMSADNTLYWKEKFTMPNNIIMSYLNINISSFTRARKELIENNYITYEKGSKNDAGIYGIVKLYEEDESCESLENGEEVTEKCDDDEMNVQQNCEESETKVNTYNKQNKTEQNEIIKETKENEIEKKKEEERKKFGEYKNVFLSDFEYEKLKTENDNYNELINYLDCYIEEKGYKTNNCYLAINRWVKKAVNDNKIKKEAMKKGPLNNFKAPSIDFKALEDSLKRKQAEELMYSQ